MMNKTTNIRGQRNARARSFDPVKLLRFSLFTMLLMLCGGSMWAGSVTTWVKTDPTALTTNDVVVIVDQTSGKAMEANGTSAPKATEVTLKSDKSEITSGVIAAMQFKVTIGTTKVNNVDTRSYQFGYGTDYLYCTASNNGVRVGTNDDNVFIIKKADANSEKDFIFNTTQSRYLGVYNNQDWRCYTTVNNNIKGTVTAFYKKVVVESADAPDAPTFSPVAGTYYTGQYVEISCTTEGATIKKSLDGENFETYSEALPVTSTTTVYAYAELNGEKSETVSAKYVIGSTYDSFAPMQEAAAAEGFSNKAIQYRATGGMVVAYVNGNNAYLIDGSGNGILAYNKDGLGELAAGQKMNYDDGYLTATLENYQGNAELTGIVFPEMTGGTVTVTPVEKTLPLTSANQSTLVTLKGLTYNSSDQTFGDGTNTIKFYDKFKTNVVLENGKAYDVTGIVVLYNDVIEISPRTANDISEIITTAGALNAAAIAAGEEEKAVTFNFTNVKVVYAKYGYYYLADNDNSGYALLKGSQYGTEADMTTGSLITGTFTGTVSAKNGTPQASANSFSLTSKTADPNPRTPTTITIDQLGNNVNNYIKIENAELVQRLGNDITFKVGETTFKAYNSFALNVTLEEGKAYDIIGFGNYHAAPGNPIYYQILPTEITEATPAITVAKPVISGGFPTFYTEKTVAITCGTEGATIYYTTDGSVPTAESTLYTEPFTINASCTIKAIAIMDNVSSEVAEMAFIKYVIHDRYIVVGDENTPLTADENFKMTFNEEEEAYEYTLATTAATTSFRITTKIENSTLTPISINDEKYDGTVELEEEYDLGANETYPTINIAGSGIYLISVYDPGSIIITKTGDLSPFYILGDMNSWDRTNPTQMTWDATKNAYTYELNNDATVYFCFADYKQTADEAAADAEWTTFNSTYRIAYNEGGYDAPTNSETPIQLAKVNSGEATIILPAGEWTISVTPDMKMTITGEATPVTPTEAKYYVVGNMTDWDVDEAYEMTRNEGADIDEYSFTMDLTTESQFKVVKVEEGEDDVWYPDGMGNNYGENGEITADGTYTIYFRPNYDGGEDWFYNLIYVAANEPAEVTYVVAGSEAEIFGTSWDGTNEANKMTKQTDGTYQKTYTVDQAYESVLLKVVKNGSEWIGGDTGDNVSFNLTGAGDFTVTINPETNVVSVTGDIVQFPTTFEYESVYAVGDGLGTLTGWSFADDNKLTESTETSGVYSITYNNVPASEAVFKFALDRKWDHNFGGTKDGDNAFSATIGTEYDAVYDGANISITTTETSNVTLTLDLSNFDFNTKQGAKFTITSEAVEEPAGDVTATWDFTSNANPRAVGLFNGTTGTLDSNVAGIVLDIDARNGKFDSQDRTSDAQVNSGTIIKVPIKGAGDEVTIVGNWKVSYTIGSEAEAVTDLNKTYTATAADAQQGHVTITSTDNNTYFYSITVVQKATSGEEEEEVTGTFFSAKVAATTAQSFESGTTEITADQATIEGGKMYAINGQSAAKNLIDKGKGGFCMTNNNTIFKVELDHALEVGDVITANGNGGVKNNLPKGLWVSTSETYPTEAPACAGTSETEGTIDNLLNYTVADGDEYVGKKTLYIFRAAGATQYFDNFAITRPADEPVAEDVTATWDWQNGSPTSITSTNIQGKDATGTVDSNVEGIQLNVLAAVEGTTVKLQYNSSGYAQFNQNTAIRVPVKSAGDEVTVVSYSGQYHYTIGGTAATGNETTYKATSSDASNGYVEIVATSTAYLYSITVVQKAPKPAGLKEKAIIDTDFQDWAKSSTTTEVTTKYTNENITFTYSNATVDPDATNEGKFPTTTDAAYKGYIMSNKSEATITTTTFANISKIRYRHGATGSNRGWGLKMKVGEGEWETVSDATVGSTPAWIEKTIKKENVQLQWYNLAPDQNAYMFELEVYANVDLSNSPLLGTLKANGTTYTADDIFEMGTDGNYAATIELASTETMPSTENPVEAVADNGEIGNITYDASNDQSIVTIPVTAGEASVNYVATFVRKPNFTLTYYNLDGEEIGTQQVEKDTKIGAFAYNIADVQAKTDGYKARGWFKNNYVGEKWTTESVITENVNLYAVETEIEVSSDSRTYRFDLTDKNFDANDHEAFNPTGNGQYHNEHGWIFGNGDKIELLVGKKATISIGLCQYSAAGSTISASNDESIEAVAETCGSTGAIEYEGEAGTLTLTINSTEGSVYIHSIKIMNTTTTNYEVNGDWIIVKEGDASSFIDALEAAKEGARIFLPNGTYDLGQKTKTTIGRSNVSIIGESMEGVIIKNKPTTEGIDVTATLLNTSSNLYMQDLTIECDAPWITNAERGVTLQDKGNQTILKNVYLKGKQDTYYSNNPSGTFYFEDGKVEGSVDYVCGNGDVYFNKTLFYTINKSTGGIGGCIAAPNTRKDFGYIFNECTLDGVANEDGQYRLGRPWADNTQCLYLNTTMNIQPRTEGWGEWSDDVSKQHSVTRYAEYNSMDADGNAISLTGRKTSFKGVANNPVLTEDEAAAYTPEAIFNGDWRPQVIATQVTAPKAELKDGVITWTPANDGATAYAIFKDGKFLGITTESSWTVEEAAGAPRRAEEPEKTGYTIRAANSRGGFGLAAEVSPATGISAIETELGGDVKIYDLNGRRVMTPTKGVYIINGRKVVIK